MQYSETVCNLFGVDSNYYLAHCISADLPLIGCGLDRLEWYKVSALIKRLFSDIDIEILVCKL